MADANDAELGQVLLGKLRERDAVDVVCVEGGGVLSEALGAQPATNLRDAPGPERQPTQV